MSGGGDRRQRKLRDFKKLKYFTSILIKKLNQNEIKNFINTVILSMRNKNLILFLLSRRNKIRIKVEFNQQLIFVCLFLFYLYCYILIFLSIIKNSIYKFGFTNIHTLNLVSVIYKL